ncbi:MAG: P-loop NTPase [Alkalispirochaetaceae bacterium]
MRIIPVASGKGGVGKSLLSVNLALALGQAGYRVVLADLDLGGSNLHLMLGTPALPASIGTFLSGSSSSFDEIIFPTEYENVSFIPGDSEIPGLANLSASQKSRLNKQLKRIEADYLVLDLGAGTYNTIVDFFLLSSHGIIVTSPTPTATVNAYLFLKNAAFRILYSSVKRKSPGAEYLKSLKEQGGALGRVYLPQLAEQLKEVDPESYDAFARSYGHFRPRLVLNMLEDPKDAEKANRLRRSVQHYLNLDLLHLGVIYRDEVQDVALGSRLPILRYKPQSILSQAVVRITEKLMQLEEEDEAPLDIEALDDSYDTAESDAEHDFDAKLGYVEELLQSGTLTTGDLIETIKSQQYEIVQLRKQNLLYKSKLVSAIRQGFKT